MTPKEYRERLEDLGLLGKNGVQLQASSVPEAKQALISIKQLQVELRGMKRELGLDMKVIRAHYQEQMPAAGSGVASMFSLFGKRKVAGSIRAGAKRDVAAQRNRALHEYEVLKQTIDDLLLQLEKAKLNFQRYVEEHK